MAKGQNFEMSNPVILVDWCDRYALRRGLCVKAAYFLRHTVTIFDSWLGYQSTSADLEEDRVSSWIAWLEQRYSPRTRSGLRSNLICLWRFLAEFKEVAWPGRLRKAPKPEPQPVAWTLDELRKLRLAAMAASGFIKNGASRRLYLVTLLDAAYESGLRRGDLWRLEQSSFLSNGVIVLRQNKTGWPHEPQVNQETLNAIRLLPGQNPLKWPGTEKGFYECWRIWMLRPSGVRRGVLQQIRRTGATQLESIRPADTQRYLGHKTAEMKKHYIDRSQAYGPSPQPPRYWWDSPETPRDS